MRDAQQADFGPFDASQWRVGIVTAQFNQNITQKLQDSAVKRAAAYKIAPDKIDIIKVAGSIEVPLALQHMAKSGKYNVLLAIGCIIRGETPHFDYVAKYVTEGVLRVQLDQAIPIGFGVLTCENEAQALARANLGGNFLDAALHQAKSLENI